jgi:hypothetical protein
VFDFFKKKNFTFLRLFSKVKKKNKNFSNKNNFILNTLVFKNHCFEFNSTSTLIRFTNKKTITTKLNTKKISHKSHLFLKKFIINDVIKFDFLRRNNKLLLSNSILHFFFYKNIFFSKLGLLNLHHSVLYNYNNFLPLNYIHKPLRRLIFTKFQKNYTPDFFKYLHLYVINYLEEFTKSSILFKIKSQLKINQTTKEVLNRIFIKHRNFQSKVGRGFFFFEMLEII